MNAATDTRRAYLAAEAKLADAYTRHRHWNCRFTADLLAKAQVKARIAYAAHTAARAN